MSHKKKGKAKHASSAIANPSAENCNTTCPNCGSCYHLGHVIEQLARKASETKRVLVALMRYLKVDEDIEAILELCIPPVYDPVTPISSGTCVCPLQETIQQDQPTIEADLLIEPQQQDQPTITADHLTEPQQQDQPTIEADPFTEPQQQNKPITDESTSSSLQASLETVVPSAPSKEPWSKVVQKKSKKATAISTAATLRNFALAPHSNIADWTKTLSTPDQPTALYIRMPSRSYAPIKDWLYNGCQIPRQAISDMCWYDSTTLELITTTSLKPAIVAALIRAQAQLIGPPNGDPIKEQHRLVLMKGRTKSVSARSFYSQQLTTLCKQNPNLPTVTFSDLLLAKQQKQERRHNLADTIMDTAHS